MREPKFTGIAQLVEHWSPKPGVGSSSLSSRAKQKKTMFNSIVTYCKDSYEELAHKTQWPTRMELTHTAIVVLAASIVIALIVFCMDTVFDELMKLVYSVF